METGFRELAEQSLVGIAINDAKGYRYVNRRFAEIFGYTRDEIMRMTPGDLVAKKDRLRVLEAIRRRRRGKVRSSHYTFQGIRKDGRPVEIEIHGSRMRIAGRPAAIAFLVDITERKEAEVELRRVNRALRTLGACDAALVRATAEADLLCQVCRAVVAEGGYRLAWVGYARQDDTKTVQPVAHSGFEDGYLENLKITWADVPRGRGPTGSAIRTGRPAVCRDMHHDPAFRPWRKDALRRGYASSVVLPLMAGARAFGALSIYAAEPDAFDPGEVKLLTELADNLAFGILALRERAARQEAAEALQRANAYNRSLLEASLDPLVMIGPDGKITDVNAATEAATGRSRRALIGTDFSDYFTEPARARAGYELVFGEGLVRDYPLELRHRDGTVRSVLYNASVYRGEKGQVAGVFAAARDITARKQAEAALRQEQAQLDSLAGAVPDSIYFKDRESRFVRINEALARRFGLTGPEAAIGKTDSDFFSEEHARQTRDDERRSMRTGEPLVGLEEKETWPDGHVTWVSTTKVPLRNEAGEITGLVGISRDITEQKRAVERVREQAAMLDRASDAIYVAALDNTILYWNQAAERIYGWPAAEALGRRTTDLVCAGVPDAPEISAAVMSHGEWSGERGQATKAGQTVAVFSRMTLLRDEQGQPRSILTINTDITEKKQLEARFMRAQRLESIGALASGIAHDLNNVLAPIIMGATLLRDSARDDTGRNLVAMMEKSAQRGASIVRQVLTFARGSEGQRVPLQLKHLIRDIVKMTEETFPKNIQVEDQSAAEAWPIEGDATQLHQALLNLCVNARDAMPEGGRLILAVENASVGGDTAAQTPGAREGPFVRLRVSDTGTGIPPELQDRVFEPFFTTKGLGKGTGLGLSTVVGIVKGHGGFIRLDSRVGQGTTFDLFFPARPAGWGLLGAGTAVSATPWQRSEGEGVLVVDDEAAVREVARQALEEFGYRVIVCGTGAEAVQLFRSERTQVRLVVTDMMMPEMDGPSLVQALRAIDPAVKIVGITGVADAATMERLQGLALAALVAKPFSIGQLLRAMRAARPTAGAAEIADPGA